MNIYQKHADSLRALQDEQGDSCPTFTPQWGAKQPIRILPGGLRTKKDNSAGGFSLDSDLQLTCLMADFGANPPSSREVFTYLGGNYRITSVTLAPNAIQVRINADNAAQKL
jgi:hypothetical protein